MREQFYHKGMGRLYEGPDARAFARAHYARVAPGSKVAFIETGAGGADTLTVIVGGREVGHVFGRGIATAERTLRSRGRR